MKMQFKLKNTSGAQLVADCIGTDLACRRVDGKRDRFFQDAVWTSQWFLDTYRIMNPESSDGAVVQYEGREVLFLHADLPFSFLGKTEVARLLQGEFLQATFDLEPEIWVHNDAAELFRAYMLGKNLMFEDQCRDVEALISTASMIKRLEEAVPYEAAELKAEISCRELLIDLRMNTACCGQQQVQLSFRRELLEHSLLEDLVLRAYQALVPVLRP